ncbi:ABC transporter ATP-binding protein [Natronobeatus ordinarius]|uniref:ABC transporter ATP-binding protein n=1 Tax=Natronobeatus ordinarius TaxID=2963433 RepID=UPI0020CE113C|nr:ABC transporter ATP-binding protein [Natronobeatus ordinarius]
MKLEVNDVSFTYGSVEALTGVSVSVDAGQFVAIVGPNGAGKSTLVRCINRILTPDSGTVFLEDSAVCDLSRTERAQTLGYVPQERGERFPTTVFDVVLMGRKPYMDWNPSDEDLELVWDVLEELELAGVANRDFSGLSGGQRQKVAMARALAQDPEVLLLDEPTSNLDLKHQLQVLDIASQQTDDGVSVIVVIHDLNLAARYADKVLLLNREGAVHAAGGVDVLRAEHIEPVYDVTVRVERNGPHRYIIPESVGHRPTTADADRADPPLVE